MIKTRFTLITIPLILGLISCGPTRFVVPLAKNENAVSVDLGGPLAKIPGVSVMPIPFTSITYGRGITSELTVHGSWYTTGAFLGVAQVGAGASYEFWKSKDLKHGFSGMLGFNTALDFPTNNFKFWPQLDAHYYWKYNERSQVQDDLLVSGGKPSSNALYIGIGTWYELNGTKAHEQRQTTRVVPMLNIGHDLNWKMWSFKFEVKLIAPFSSNENVVLDYISATGKTGATGIYLGFTRKF